MSFWMMHRKSAPEIKIALNQYRRAGYKIKTFIENLEENLAAYDKTVYKIPIVLQYNKRDLRNLGVPNLPIDVMEADLNKELKTTSFPASALEGGNVLETLKTILKLTIKHVHGYLALKP